VSIQLVLGGIMFVGLFFLKESPRWLCKQGRHDKAIVSLAHIRCKSVDSPEIIQEMAEIRASIEEELNATEGVTWKECLTPGNRKRFAIGFMIMFWQQFSGTNSIGYYAPQIFQTIGLSKSDSSMFATGIYGTVKVIATAIFLFVGIDRFGRKKSLIAGGFWMAAMMFIIGAVLATHPPDPEATGVGKASIAMVAMIYLFVIGYSASWGPVPWVLVSEIFPTRLRAYGVGMAGMYSSTFARRAFVLGTKPNFSPSCNPMALQLRHHQGHTIRHQQHRMAYIPDVRHLLLGHGCLRLGLCA
jgi:hypothetical protein